ASDDVQSALDPRIRAGIKLAALGGLSQFLPAGPADELFQRGAAAHVSSRELGDHVLRRAQRQLHGLARILRPDFLQPAAHPERALFYLFAYALADVLHHAVRGAVLLSGAALAGLAATAWNLTPVSGRLATAILGYFSRYGFLL